MPRRKRPERRRRRRGSGSVQFIERLQAHQAVLPRLYGRRSKCFDTKPEAEAWLDAELTRLRASPIPTAAADLGAYCSAWLARTALSRGLDPATARRYDDAFRRLNATGVMRDAVTDLKPSHVEAAVATMVELGYARHTITNTRNVLHNALESAREDGLIPSNPVVKSRGLRASQKEAPKSFSAEEARALLRACADGPLWLFVPLAIGTGARVSELRALTWDDIDWRLGVVRIANQIDDHGELKPATKSRRARAVQLPIAVLGLLERARAERERASRWLFPGKGHGPLAYSTVYQMFKAVQVAAGLATLRSPHSLRHTLVSLVGDRGVPMTSIAEAVGHSSPGVTSAVYSHASPSNRGAVAAAIQEALWEG